MTTSFLASNAAHTVARILANRPTPQEEIHELIETVFAAVRRVTEPTPAEPVSDARGAPAPAKVPGRPRGKARQRRELVPFRAVDVEDEPAATAPAPTLLRRAAVVTPATEPTPTFLTPTGSVRGIVKWFDARTRRGALRLPGYGNDVPVEPSQLAEAGIARLFKGQEVEAQIDRSGDTANLVRLILPGGATPILPSAGVVRGRHAKPVVVELKRESLRRAAAREEAEQLLRPARPR